ncbi:hypothetical protein GCM10027321_32100 [Massilia terrae]|uniref:Matrixin family metalloprotease n=1 Tax=Massilia terrae TaxID=1811224 RepID=A0ABT2CSK9_9BURK|nr:matrixin family metalloprotease [Massilia terrae]MCS0656755.1 matrixin family metalloprotease [Massilia terrae]
MIDNVNKSPLLAQQFVDYNNDVLQNKALPLSDSSGNGTYTQFAGGKVHIWLDLNENWANGKTTYSANQSGGGDYIAPEGEFAAVMSHELGHYENAPNDLAMENALHPTDPGYLTSLTALQLYGEGEATYNNFLVRKELISNGGIDSGVRATSAVVVGMYAEDAQYPTLTPDQRKVYLSGMAGNLQGTATVSGGKGNYWDFYYAQNVANHPGAKPAPASSSVDLMDMDKDGHYEECIVHNADGSDVITVDRDCSMYISNPNTTVYVANGITATLEGGGFTVNAGQGSTLWVGANGQVSPDSQLITVNSYGANVKLLNDSRLNIIGQGIGGVTHVDSWGGDNVGILGHSVEYHEHNISSGSNVWAGTNGTSTIGGNTSSGGDITISNEIGTITVLDNSSVNISNGDYGISPTVSSRAVYIQSNSYVWTDNSANEKYYMNGDHSQLDMWDYNSTIYQNGTNNLVNIRDTGDVVYSSGTGNKVNDYAPHANVYAQGQYQYVWIYDSTSTVYITYSTSSQGGAPAENYYYFWGFGGNSKSVTEKIKSGDSPVIDLMKESANPLDSNAAAVALKQLQYIINTDAHTTVTGTRWDSTTITWSFDLPPGNGENKVSPKYQAAIIDAFNAWTQATGIHFQQVKDGSFADVSIEFSNLNNRDTNLLGATSFNAENGRMKAGALIQLDKPSDVLLTPTGDGNFSYNGTDATLKQVAMHEIGHILGLGTNNDPASIEYYLLGSQNRNISNADLDVIYSIYPELGHSPAKIIGPSWSDADLPHLVK